MRIKAPTSGTRIGLIADIFLVLFLALLLVKGMLFILPFPQLEAFQRSPYSLPVLDRKGEVLRVLALPDGTRREFRPLAAVPREIREIFIASEDKNFYGHPGVDGVSLLRAAVLDARRGAVVSGGSTVTMQLARIVCPHGPGPGGKIEEMLNAFRLEGKLSKDNILELWLNGIPFGSRAVGVASAAEIFFGEPLERLTPAQALMLAVIPRRPALYQPAGNPAALKTAALALGKRIGLSVNDSDFDGALAAAAQNLTALPRPFHAPHFVNYLARELTPADYSSGAPVKTSLDLALNDMVEAELNAQIAAAARNRIANGAALMIDNRTGEILVYVGSQNFFDDARAGQIDGVRVKNQPGSTLKPFLYALALESGFTAATVLPDVPTRFGGEESYVPLNFNRRFNGPVRLRSALASSLNIPAVYTLDRIGVPAFVQKLRALDFDSLRGQEERAGVGLAIGNAEVPLFELVRAFSVFPRDGKKNTVTWRLGDGRPAEGEQVYRATTAGVIRDILADRKSRITGFGTRSVLNTRFSAIFKTGTSNQFNNTWALGATPRYTMGVWMGNFSGSTVIGIPGSSKPSQVVVDVLSRLARPGEAFPPVAGARQARICALSGGRALPYCPAAILEYFPEGVDPPPCAFHRLENGRTVTDYPPEYQVWAASTGRYHESPAAGPITAPAVASPKNGSVFYFDPSLPEEDQTVRIEVVSAPQDEISLFVNGELWAKSPAPFVDFIPMERGRFEIRAEGKAGAALARFEVR